MSGGNQLFKGFKERIERDNYFNQNYVRFISNKKINAWIGGSIISQISTFQYYIITKDEYNKWGS